MISSDKPTGLEGVKAGRTAISDLDPAADRLFYRGYDIEDLAAQASFEETAFLLLNGELPTRSQLAAFSRELRKNRRAPGTVARVRALLTPPVHPMDALRTAVSALGALQSGRGPSSPENLRRQAVSLLGMAPRLIAGESRRRALPGLSHAGDFLWRLTGRPPGDLDIRAFDATLILYAEHGFNASTFAARVTASTLSDLYAAVTSAIGTLKGPLHGGANEKAMDMIRRIGRPDRARAWVLAALGRKEKIMGFGHRVYRTRDSRHGVAKRWALELSREKKNMRWFEIAERVEEVLREEKGLFPNLDFYSSIVYHLMGIPIRLYTPIFAASRLSGWCAHVLEQLADNRLIRPDADYVGPPPRPYVPLANR